MDLQKHLKRALFFGSLKQHRAEIIGASSQSNLGDECAAAVAALFAECAAAGFSPVAISTEFVMLTGVNIAPEAPAPEAKKEPRKKGGRVNEAREALKALSEELKTAQSAGMLPETHTLNELIIQHYKSESGAGPIFKTYKQWSADGFKVRKGSKGFAVWARPMKALKEAAGEDAPEKGGKFHPICYLFASNQVDKI